MTKGVVSAKRRESARKHASRTWTCRCGKVCRGNGGKTSHQSACKEWQQAMLLQALAVPRW